MHKTCNENEEVDATAQCGFRTAHSLIPSIAVCYGIYLWLGLYAALGYALFNLIVGAWLGFELVHTRCSDD